MDKQEFFLLIPAIIYGVAIVDLLKIFQHKKNYWEILAWGILLLIIVVNVWTELYQKLGSLVDNNLNFFVIITQAIFYALSVSIITPEEVHTDTKEYFFSVKRNFFLILAATTFFNIVVQLLVFDDQRAAWIRPTGIVLLLICAYVDKIWVRTSILVFIYMVALMIVFIS